MRTENLPPSAYPHPRCPSFQWQLQVVKGKTAPNRNTTLLLEEISRYIRKYRDEFRKLFIKHLSVLC